LDDRKEHPVISLRHTALVWMTVLLSAVGAVAIVISYQLARNEAASFLDGQLRQIALNAGEGLPESAGPPAPHDSEDDFVIEIWNAAGESLRTSSGAIAIPRQPVFGFSTIAASGEDWRVYTSGDGRRIVQAAQRVAVRQEIAQRAAIETAAPILAVIPLAWLVIGWIFRRLFGQLSDVARAIAERGIDSKEPITLTGVPTEVSPLVEAMNILIGRLQHALDQQRRFVSDAAHELRTPLTALYLQIENLRTATPADLASSPSELSSGIRRAAALLEQLLRMARFDAPAEPAQRQSIDLSGLITECVADYIPIASSKNVDLGIVTREKTEVSGVPAELKILFGNLLDNAVRFTPEGGNVDVSVRRQDGQAIVEVLDSGCGVNESDLPFLFDRFFRAASPDIEGSGLGLAIVDAIAKRNGLIVNIENRYGQTGLLVRVSIPLNT
jgi:two-component system OmpR family sensor kinase